MLFPVLQAGRPPREINNSRIATPEDQPGGEDGLNGRDGRVGAG